MECWICGGNTTKQTAQRRTQPKEKGRGKRARAKRATKARRGEDKVKQPFPMDVHTETFKKVSVIIGEDGLVPCLHHIAKGSCPATDCPRSHNASMHKITDKEKKSCKLELTRRANLREHKAKAKAKAKAVAAATAGPTAKAKACPQWKKDKSCSAGNKCPYVH